jgi:flagellar assembly protein FliH
MTRYQSRFISSDQVQDSADWKFDPVDQAALRFAAKLRAQELAEDQVKDSMLRQAGFEEGYAQGHAQATLEGQRLLEEYIATQGEEAARQFASLFGAAQAQIAQSEQVLALGVLQLACELARHVVRHEIASNPNVLQPVVREAIAVLAADCKAAIVRLHPLDIEVLEDTLRVEFAGLALTLIPDSTMNRGGCVVEAAGTVVDGTVEKRWARTVASLGMESAWEEPQDASP